MLDYMKIRDIIYKYPDLNDNEIAEKLIKDNPDILDSYQKDTIRRKVNFLRELPPDFTYIPPQLFSTAIERYLLEKKIVKKKIYINLFIALNLC